MPIPSSHTLPAPLLLLAQRIREAGGRALVVGGSNRDALLNLAVKDFDVEVFGLEAPVLQALLTQHYRVHQIGASFGVFHLPDLGLDVSIPRKEEVRGPGHRDFTIDCDPFLSLEQASLRRDFTLNAIYRDPLTGEWLDPCNGIHDLNQRILRPVSPKFIEDPLRVLRAMQFIARFSLSWTEDLVDYSKSCTQEHLPVERLEMEWKKLILQGIRISRGLEFLKSCGWLRFYPELEALVGCPQDPIWHPEGDVWQHTLHCMDAFAELRSGVEMEDWITGLGVLCHDMGKPETTAEVDGRIRSLQHERKGVPHAERFLRRITRQKVVIEGVLPLVEYHMTPHSLSRNRASDKSLRRFVLKVGRIDRLLTVVDADRRGRPPLPHEPAPELDWLKQRLAELSIDKSPPKPLILGRHLLEMGFQPGPELGKTLKQVFEAQLAGVFNDFESGLEWTRGQFKKKRDAQKLPSPLRDSFTPRLPSP